MVSGTNGLRSLGKGGLPHGFPVPQAVGSGAVSRSGPPPQGRSFYYRVTTTPYGQRVKRGSGMLHIAIQVKELVSSNLNAIVETAGNPVKMLRLLQQELQEFVIALQGDLTKARRRAERLGDEAAKLDRTAAGWSEKAQVAISHKREDLARAALLTREQAFADAEQARDAAKSAAAEADEIGQAMTELKAKLAETNARLVEEIARPKADSTGGSASCATRAERFADRVTTLEKRVGFVAGGRAKAAPVAVDAEIEQLRREARVNEELAAMKAAAKSPPVRTRKTKA